MAANAVSGAAAFVAVIGQWTVFASILTAGIAVASAVETALKPSEKARLHGDLGRRFTGLAAEIATMPATKKNLDKVVASRLKIEMDELPERRLVDLLCYNEEARARGIGQEHFWPLSGLQRALGYCLTFDLKRLDDWHDARGSRQNDATDDQ